MMMRKSDKPRCVYPRIRPDKAIPDPLIVPPEAFMFFRAMWPMTTAGMLQKIPNIRNDRIPRTRLQIAAALVRETFFRGGSISGCRGLGPAGGSCGSDSCTVPQTGHACALSSIIVPHISHLTAIDFSFSRGRGWLPDTISYSNNFYCAIEGTDIRRMLMKYWAESPSGAPMRFAWKFSTVRATGSRRASSGVYTARSDLGSR